MNDNIIEIKNLYKSFGDIKAVNGLSFNVKKGELFAFLGANGAGKSTTINIICGQLSKDKGDVTVNGYNLDYDIQKIKELIGVVFQESTLDKNLSVYDNLKYRAAMYNVFGNEFQKRLDYLSQILDFKDFLKRNVGKLSGGQRRRVDVARALIHQPQILILDEPTTALDPYSRKLLWSTIKDMQINNGMTVFLTTHYMEETNDANYVVILDNGKIVASDNPQTLKTTYTGDFIYLYNVSEEAVKKLNFPYEVVSNGFKIEINNFSLVNNLILQHPQIFKDFEIIKGTMDDVFLAVTGKKLDEGMIV